MRAIAIPGALVQIAVGNSCSAWGLAWFLGWPVQAGLVFGLALSVASTVVLLRALQERHLLNTERGKIAVGWLIVEDLVMVLTLVLLPAIAPLFTSGETVSSRFARARSRRDGGEGRASSSSSCWWVGGG